MLVWVEVRPYQQTENIDLSIYYKRLGFHLTNPTKHDIQYIVPASVLSIINDTGSYSYIMRCSQSIQKQEENVWPINAFTKGKYDMCQASGCALVCQHKIDSSHNKLEITITLQTSPIRPIKNLTS